MICQICENKSEFSICLKCKGELLKHRWLGCARCGRIACEGCSHLPSFSRVRSSFVLQSLFAKWLSTAKDANDDWAITTFEQTFLANFCETICRVVVTYDIDYLVLMPFRLNRLVTKPWHPNLALFDRFCSDEILRRHLVGIFMGTHSEDQKIAHVASATRTENENQNAFPYLVWDGPSVTKLNEARRVLIIDDVLTSGTSALRCQKSNLPFTISPSTDWLLHTIFRTPRSNTTAS